MIGGLIIGALSVYSYNEYSKLHSPRRKFLLVQCFDVESDMDDSKKDKVNKKPKKHAAKSNKNPNIESYWVKNEHETKLDDVKANNKPKIHDFKVNKEIEFRDPKDFIARSPPIHGEENVKK